jgi:hypothetical protein
MIVPDRTRLIGRLLFSRLPLRYLFLYLYSLLNCRFPFPASRVRALRAVSREPTAAQLDEICLKTPNEIKKSTFS